jgi:hypothetical protein
VFDNDKWLPKKKTEQCLPIPAFGEPVLLAVKPPKIWTPFCLSQMIIGNNPELLIVLIFI